MFMVATPMGLVWCLLANVVIPMVDVLSDMDLALRLWKGPPGYSIKRYEYFVVTFVNDEFFNLLGPRFRSPALFWKLQLPPPSPIAGLGLPGGMKKFQSIL